jgi:hypothetical protein
VQEAWQEHLSCKPSSCIPSLKDGSAGDDGKQSFCHCRWPNSLTVSDDSEELFPSLSRIGRKSLPTM